MLFEQDSPYKIVGSSAKGLLQHDIMTWELEGNQLIEKQGLTNRCKLLNEMFDNWIEDVDMEQRETFTKDFFDALGAGGTHLMLDIANGGVDSFESILGAIGKSDAKTKPSSENLSIQL